MTAQKKKRKQTPRHMDDYITFSLITETGEPKDYQEAITCAESD